MDAPVKPLLVCCQVFEQLAGEGYQISAARVPLSRERVPEAADLDTLHSLHTPPPEGDCLANTMLHCQHLGPKPGC
jgi:hypothetical protein